MVYSILNRKAKVRWKIIIKNRISNTLTENMPRKLSRPEKVLFAFFISRFMSDGIRIKN